MPEVRSYYILAETSYQVKKLVTHAKKIKGHLPLASLAPGLPMGGPKRAHAAVASGMARRRIAV